MNDDLKFQLRLTLTDEFAQVARTDPGNPSISRLTDILSRHDAVMKCQFDAFADYVSEAEDKGVENFPLYDWTKRTIEEPAQTARSKRDMVPPLHGHDLPREGHMAIHIGRREFITLLGGAAAWPLAARGQQPESMRRIGVLMSTAVDDPQDPARLAAFAQGLQELGWTAAELVALAPDVMLASGTIALAAAQQIRHTTPIVFANLIDPVSGGFVESLARPGGNTTGFLLFEYGISGKWLELLKEIAPRVTRVAVLRDPTQSGGTGQFGAIQSAASQLGVEFRPVGVRDAREIERGITDFGRGPNGGLIVTAGTQAREHRELIIGLAARHRLPAVYFNRLFVEAGGLISYGADTIDPLRRAANYVDRILKGEKPGNLPVQAPTKFELAINLKTAKALGIDVPTTLLARADGLIE
jgi:putative tryptophan/tyrosine transport system substrate-binding protein